MNDVEVTERFWQYFTAQRKKRFEERNVANRIFQVPVERWAKYRIEDDDMLTMQ